MQQASGMIPQLIVEIDQWLADLMDRMFGEGAFGAWYDRMVTSGSLVQAWSDEAPPLHCMLDDAMEDQLGMHEGGSAHAVEFDDAARNAGKYVVRIVPVETGVPNMSVELSGWITAVPGMQPGIEQEGDVE